MSLVSLDAAPLVEPVAAGWQLVLAALLAIGLIVVLITWAKVHPFLALILGGLAVGILAGQNINDVITSFSLGFGATAAGVGALIALGAMFAKLLADSGGADQIVDTIVGRSSQRALPWAMAGVGALIGLPMFFEIGLVLLMPVIYLVARRAQLSVIAVPERSEGPGILGLPSSGGKSSGLTTDAAVRWSSKLDEGATEIEAVLAWHRSTNNSSALDPVLESQPRQILQDGDLGIWTALGFTIYALYGYRHSRLRAEGR